MPKNEHNDSETGNQTKSYAKYSALGFQMIAIIGLFAFVGYNIDASANHATKWVTATLSLMGVFISLYLVIRSVKN